MNAEGLRAGVQFADAGLLVSRVHEAFRKVLATYCHGLKGHQLNPDQLCVLFQLIGAARPRGELQKSLTFFVPEPAEVIAGMLQLGYVEVDADENVSLSTRGGEVLTQIQKLAQPANEKWRAEAASAASAPDYLTLLLTMLQTSEQAPRASS